MYGELEHKKYGMWMILGETESRDLNSQILIEYSFYIMT